MGLLDWFSGSTDEEKKKAAAEMRAAAEKPLQPTPPLPGSKLIATLNGAQMRDYKPLEPLPWPTPQDAEEARQYKQKYGDPDTQMIQRGTEMSVVPGWQAGKVSSGLLAPPTPTPIDQAAADKLMQEQIAARQSPLPYLGYDRDRIAPTVDDNDPAHPGHYVVSNGPWGELAGTYVPSKDQIWTDLRDNNQGFTVHESTHRGVEMLRQAGAPPLSHDDEEIMVRALQLKHYGNIESGNSPQIDEARKRMKDPAFMAKLNDYERRATQMIAKRLLERGPM